VRIRHANSKITKKCVVCSNLTSSSKIYEEGSISIRVPVCGREENSVCQDKVAIKQMTKKMLRELKEEISTGRELEEATS
jgi:hypothetical protein